MHNRLHCAAVLACHFCLVIVAIRVDIVHIYLCGNVKVVVEGRGFARRAGLNTKTQLREKQQKSHRGYRRHLSAHLCETDEGSCCETYTWS